MKAGIFHIWNSSQLFLIEQGTELSLSLYHDLNSLQYSQIKGLNAHLLVWWVSRTQHWNVSLHPWVYETFTNLHPSNSYFLSGFWLRCWSKQPRLPIHWYPVLALLHRTLNWFIAHFKPLLCIEVKQRLQSGNRSLPNCGDQCRSGYHSSWRGKGHANILDTHSERNFGETRHIQICSVLGLQ